jgi:hypothetical protein
MATRAIMVLLFVGGPAHGNDSTEERRNLSVKAADLAREYRELRAKRRHQAPGVSVPELDGSGGSLERILSVLGVELGHPPNTRTMIVKYLGEPDAILGNRKMAKFLGIYERTQRKSALKSERKYLIYFWRGWHDFLFFISEGDVIVDHGWWFAYE